MTLIVFLAGILSLVLIVWAAVNVVVRKKRVDGLYSPFDDATRGVKEEDRHTHR